MSDSNDTQGWLLRPPEPGQIHFALALGEGVELSAEARDALDLLTSELLTNDVQGFSKACPSLKGCTSYHCVLGKCILDSYPCYAHTSCQVASF